MSDKLNSMWPSLNQSQNLFNLVTNNHNSNQPPKFLDIQQGYWSIFTKNIQRKQQFFQQSGVIPENWTITETGKNFLQFNNGVRVIFRSDQISFSEMLKYPRKSPETLTLINRYSEKYSDDKYQGIVITFKRLVSFPGKLNGAVNYFKDNLINSEISQNLVSGKINLIYQLDQYEFPLTLEIESVKFKQVSTGLVPALLFTGKFKYQTQEITAINQHSNEWIDDWKIFNKIINKGFLR